MHHTSNSIIIAADDDMSAGVRDSSHCRYRFVQFGCMMDDLLNSLHHKFRANQNR